MDNKTLLGLGLLGFVFLFRQSGGGSQQRYFRLPNGNVVPEQQLPNYGYVMYQGVWVPVDYLNQAEGGTNFSAEYWQSIISSSFDFAQAGVDFWQYLQNQFGNQYDDLILDPYRDASTGYA